MHHKQSVTKHRTRLEVRSPGRLRCALCRERHRLKHRFGFGLASPGGSGTNPQSGALRMWQNTGSRGCRTEVPISSLAVSWGYSWLLEDSLQSLHAVPTSQSQK